jgi:lipid-A-disaccharide synthase
VTERAAQPLLIFLVAGEPSGDMLGGRLMAALAARSSRPLRFVGVGGDRMAQQGLERLFPLDDIAVMGAVEVLPRLPRILQRIRQTADAVTRLQPAAVVTIDSPDFNFRVAAKLARQHSTVPRVHYVAPTVWAWRSGRARRMATLFNHLLALFPFEPPLFEKAGLACTFIGHPAAEDAERGDGAAFRRRHGIPTDAPLLLVLPGSRHSEVSRLLPVFRDTVRLIMETLPGLRVAMPTVSTVAATVGAAAADWPVPATLVETTAEKADAFAAGDAALAASGTVALELALAGVPMVIGYRLNPFTGWLARRLVKVTYVSPVNLVLDRAVVPELLLGDCRPDWLAEAVLPLLRDSEVRRSQIAAFAEVGDRLGAGDLAASDRAAAVILGLASDAVARQV